MAIEAEGASNTTETGHIMTIDVIMEMASNATIATITIETVMITSDQNIATTETSIATSDHEPKTAIKADHNSNFCLNFIRRGKIFV